MIGKKFLGRSWRALLIIILLSYKAEAATVVTNGTVTVQIVVESSCTIEANPLNFGSYSVAAVSSTTGLNVTCTNSTPYTIGLSAGSANGATVTTRKMTSGVKTLKYELYQDAAKTIIWGNTPWSDTVNGIGTGVQQVVNVYGYIPAAQIVATGNYVDTITATIYF